MSDHDDEQPWAGLVKNEGSTEFSIRVDVNGKQTPERAVQSKTPEEIGQESLC